MTLALGAGPEDQPCGRAMAVAVRGGDVAGVVLHTDGGGEYTGRLGAVDGVVGGGGFPRGPRTVRGSSRASLGRARGSERRDDGVTVPVARRRSGGSGAPASGGST